VSRERTSRRGRELAVEYASKVAPRLEGLAAQLRLEGRAAQLRVGYEIDDVIRAFEAGYLAGVTE
jgi:hypothetical protein